ncbi:MAG: spermidine synthase [Glaciecola sp.]|jgi:spermidine synthase
MKISDSKILMSSLFATGIAGIVSEYVLATLATYFLGNSVFQWTIILSIMLFSMGLGSRLSKSINKYVIEYFIAAELLLSLLTSVCALFVYSIMGVTTYIQIFIYFLAILIGLLIGLEIPLVTRINGRYHDLKANISDVMEKDYYGSLIGGLFFAFIGLPYLGLTYTPFVLGTVNLIVATLLFLTFSDRLNPKIKKLLFGSIISLYVLIALGVCYAKPIILFGEQSRYGDKVVYSQQTKYQKITLTSSNNHHILYLNNSMQLNTMDEWLYHEPLVHVPMLLNSGRKNILILGGGDGCAIREVLKYPEVESIKIIDLDPGMTNFGANNPVFKELNENSYHDKKVTIVNQDAFIALESDSQYYDLIIIDFPDPRSIELSRLYTKEMYAFCQKRLKMDGIIITQATSPYFQTKSFHCIKKTMQSAGLNTLPIHNHVQSFGEWGWIIGSKLYSKKHMIKMLSSIDTLPVKNTRWLTTDALEMMCKFGKPVGDTTEIEVNSIHNPVLFKYYIKGTEFNQNFYE